MTLILGSQEPLTCVSGTLLPHVSSLPSIAAHLADIPVEMFDFELLCSCASSRLHTGTSRRQSQLTGPSLPKPSIGHAAINPTTLMMQTCHCVSRILQDPKFSRGIACESFEGGNLIMPIDSLRSIETSGHFLEQPRLSLSKLN